MNLLNTVGFAVAPRKMVERIHSEFNGAQDKLLAEANAIVANGANETIVKRLVAQGLSQHPLVKKHKEDEETQQRATALANQINQLNARYPLHRVITRKMVVSICSRYNLIYGQISRYKGDIPVKNLEEMERFKPTNEDKATTDYYSNRLVSREYMICAPKRDMDTSNMEVKGFQLVAIPPVDPVVLYPVGGHHWGNEDDMFAIVTAWGAEASDEMVMNARMN